MYAFVRHKQSGTYHLADLDDDTGDVVARSEALDLGPDPGDEPDLSEHLDADVYPSPPGLGWRGDEVEVVAEA